MTETPEAAGLPAALAAPGTDYFRHGLRVMDEPPGRHDPYRPFPSQSRSLRE